MTQASSNNLRNVRIILWVAVVAVGLLASAYYLLFPPQRPVPQIGGAFELSRTDGTSFTQDDLVGTPSLMFFGYTFCPDVCPTSMAETVAWRDALGLTSQDLNIIFVTVDPERDLPEDLQAYVEIFGDIIALRGDEAQTDVMKKAYGVVAEKVIDESVAGYLVNHTASVYLLDRQGNFAGTIAYGESGDTARGKISNLLTR